MTFRGKQTGTHRVSWILTFGEIPDGLFVLHRCDNPPCLNPQHLFLGTHLENIADKISKGRQTRFNAFKTHCPSGHPYDGENTYTYPNGYRFCRKCGRASAQRTHAKRKATKKGVLGE